MECALFRKDCDDIFPFLPLATLQVRLTLWNVPCLERIATTVTPYRLKNTPLMSPFMECALFRKDYGATHRMPLAGQNGIFFLSET